jgi:hypothetical protein
MKRTLRRTKQLRLSTEKLPRVRLLNDSELAAAVAGDAPAPPECSASKLCGGW